MALSNLTKVQTVGVGSNIEVVGVITTGQFKSGTSNLHSTGVELTNLNVSGIATIGGNLSIGGTLTCLLYTSPSPRDLYRSRMPSSA